MSKSKNTPIQSFRKQCLEQPLTKDILASDPIEQLLIWMSDAKEAAIDEHNAMVLATATKEGIPSSRTVLLKKCDQRGLIFYTNYESRKSAELNENPQASVTIYWKELGRQIIVEGRVERISPIETEPYFKTRPRGSQLAAWTSRQDQPINSRHELEQAYQETKEHFKEKEIPLPSFWGGFLLIPECFEFWKKREHRLHDRFRYSLTEKGWSLQRLSP